MEYTIREMIARKNRKLEETDYARSNPNMLDFRLFSGDFYEWDGGKPRFKECVSVMDFAQTARERGEKIAVEGGLCLFGEADETDSYRKRKKAHKKAFQMGCILIPELLSGDGIHTLYTAPTRWKAYGCCHDEALPEGELRKC